MMKESVYRWNSGRAIRLDPGMSLLERIYIWLFGVPILGLRVRARYLLPIIESLQDTGITKVVDAGSGRGLFTFQLASTFPDAEVLGFDINQVQVEKNNQVASLLGLDNCHFVFQDVTKLKAEAEFGLILSTDNLEHLEDDQRQCQVFFSSLKPGGRILFHVPHVTRNLFGWRRTNFMGIEGHVRPGYTIQGLSQMLEETGFEIEDAFYSYTWLETLANDISYLITGGREKRKALYALAFPALMVIALLGRVSKSREGSGVVVLAKKPELKKMG